MAISLFFNANFISPIVAKRFLFIDFFRFGNRKNSHTTKSDEHGDMIMVFFGQYYNVTNASGLRDVQSTVCFSQLRLFEHVMEKLHKLPVVSLINITTSWQELTIHHAVVIKVQFGYLHFDDCVLVTTLYNLIPMFQLLCIF